jgi:hypothetical protein
VQRGVEFLYIFRDDRLWKIIIIQRFEPLDVRSYSARWSFEDYFRRFDDQREKIGKIETAIPVSPLGQVDFAAKEVRPPGFIFSRDLDPVLNPIAFLLLSPIWAPELADDRVRSWLNGPWDPDQIRIGVTLGEAERAYGTHDERLEIDDGREMRLFSHYEVDHPLPPTLVIFESGKVIQVVSGDLIFSKRVISGPVDTWRTSSN